MELYDEYENNNIDNLIKFANQTFPQDGTEKLFIGCVLIMFSNCGGFKPRYDNSREKLYSIVSLAKEKIEATNFLIFYIERINTTKKVRKYLNDIARDKNIEYYADVILEYLDQFKPDVLAFIKQNYSAKLEKYISDKN